MMQKHTYLNWLAQQQRCIYCGEAAEDCDCKEKESQLFDTDEGYDIYIEDVDPKLIQRTEEACRLEEKYDGQTPIDR